MVLVSTNWRIWMAGTAASLVVFAILFFTVIQPSSHAANQALKTGLQQSQQVLNQAQQQLSNASAPANVAAGQTGGASAQASGVDKQAKHALGNATKLTTCVEQAGTDAAKIAACQSSIAH